jgi:hypothetical protein
MAASDVDFIIRCVMDNFSISVGWNSSLTKPLYPFLYRFFMSVESRLSCHVAVMCRKQPYYFIIVRVSIDQSHWFVLFGKQQLFWVFLHPRKGYNQPKIPPACDPDRCRVHFVHPSPPILGFDRAVIGIYPLQSLPY